MSWSRETSCTVAFLLCISNARLSETLCAGSKVSSNACPGISRSFHQLAVPQLSCCDQLQNLALSTGAKRIQNFEVLVWFFTAHRELTIKESDPTWNSNHTPQSELSTTTLSFTNKQKACTSHSVHRHRRENWKLPRNWNCNKLITTSIKPPLHHSGKVPSLYAYPLC